MNNPSRRTFWCGAVTTCILLVTTTASAQKSIELEIPAGALSTGTSIQIYPLLPIVVYIPDEPLSVVASNPTSYLAGIAPGNRVIIEARIPDPGIANIAIRTSGVQISIVVRPTYSFEPAITQVLFRKGKHEKPGPSSIDVGGLVGLAIASDEAASHASDKTSMFGISGRLERPYKGNFSFEGTVTVAYVATIELEGAEYKEDEGLLRRRQLLTRLSGGLNYSFTGGRVVPSLRAGLGIQGRQLGDANINLDSGAVAPGPPRDRVWDLVLSGGGDLWWPVRKSSKLGVGVVMSISTFFDATRIKTFEAVVRFSP